MAEGTASASAHPIPEFAELRCVSNFSFLKGASQPEELVERAEQLGYRAIAITDECSMAGIVRAHVAATKHKVKLLVGSQFLVHHVAPFHLIVLACNLDGYGNLCEFITRLRRSADKGTYHLDRDGIDFLAVVDFECRVLALLRIFLILPCLHQFVDGDEAVRFVAFHVRFAAQGEKKLHLAGTGRGHRGL